jgi:hypothetical protein
MAGVASTGLRGATQWIWLMAETLAARSTPWLTWQVYWTLVSSERALLRRIAA